MQVINMNFSDKTPDYETPAKYIWRLFDDRCSICCSNWDNGKSGDALYGRLYNVKETWDLSNILYSKQITHV